MARLQALDSRPAAGPSGQGELIGLPTPATARRIDITAFEVASIKARQLVPNSIRVGRKRR